MAKKVLIVEDDKFLRELIVKKLRNEGYDVMESSEGEEVIKILKDEKPDLLLLDLIIPGMDGFEILERKKEDPEIARIPVIILSNLGQQEEVERGLKLGAVDYLIKAHFSPGEIIEKINLILR